MRVSANATPTTSREIRRWRWNSIVGCHVPHGVAILLLGVRTAPRFRCWFGRASERPSAPLAQRCVGALSFPPPRKSVGRVHLLESCPQSGFTRLAVGFTGIGLSRIFRSDPKKTGRFIVLSELLREQPQAGSL